ncbi:MAG: amidohydrolase [Bacteroidia bacterium]|nr:amidohydrolase [Bacteroidia bacterium]
MKNLLLSLLFFLLLSGCEKKETADLILFNGKILTVDSAHPQVEAIATAEDKIIALGSLSDLSAYKGPDTRMIDLQGQLAIPGLIEGHGHYMRLGQTLMALDLRYAKSWEEIVDMVAKKVQEVDEGDWILGWGWHQEKWEQKPVPSFEGLPYHHSLSKISPNNPVMLSHTSGHGEFINAKAMEMAGITEETPNPEGGEIVRDEEGKALGMLRESAAQFIDDVYNAYQKSRSPEEVEKEHRQQVALAAQEALENGITSFQDMGSSFEEVALLRTMAAEGNLPVRLYMAIHDPAEIMADKLAEFRMIGFGNNYLTNRCIGEKVLDGALGTHGAWLLEPYVDLPHSSGFNVTPIDEIKRSAELAVKHDYQMAIQGIGDRATRELLDIYEANFKEHADQSDWRWRIEHAQVIHPDDLKRFEELEVIAGIQGVFACSDGPWVASRLGESRTKERGYLWRSMIDGGIRVMNGTDPPVEDIDPIASFHCSVSRVLGDGSIFAPEQRMTREQALKSYTLDNAYAAFEEDIKGSLEVGKLADITVLSQDIMTIPLEDIPETEIVYTIVGGSVKYEGK